MKSEDWRRALVSPTATILEALNVINNTADSVRIAFVVDGEGRLLGTVTDGDTRRAILRGIGLSEPVSSIMHDRPVAAGIGDGFDKILRLMRQKDIGQIPVLNGDGKIVRVESLSNILRQNRRDNPVVIMAGGLGVRLRPLTENCPKPMLSVGGKPMLETILENLSNYGFHRFWLAVNYKAEMIEEHFGDGSRWGVEIGYLREKKRLGTAGALGLLSDMPDLPVLVMNGDVLTRANFNLLMDFQEKRRADAVMCVREHEVKIPFGVVETAGEEFLDVVEKPVLTHFINAGVYVLTPSALAPIAKDEYLDMPTLFNQLVSLGRKTLVYTLTDFWLDVGRHGDLARAESELSVE